MPYSDQFSAALTYAAETHKTQVRKGSQHDLPYVTHLLAVAALVAEFGGDETAVVAALLHDAVEDQGGMARYDDIARAFGQEVADIVLQCSDAAPGPKAAKLAWRERKERYVAHAGEASPRAQLVSLCDKLHNATVTLRDLRRDGPKTFENFRGKWDGMRWYWHALFAAYCASPHVPGEAVQEFDRVLGTMDDLMGVHGPGPAWRAD
jgi:(p)ppGpp synthase/HD superfamily hydrolase